jgi:hypothetical protein
MILYDLWLLWIPWIMLRYDVDDDSLAFKYVLWNWGLRYVCGFWEELMISIYVLWIMKVKCYWTMHEHKSRSMIILYHEAWAWAWA